MDSSSDESVEEKVPVGVFGSSEIPGAAYRLKPVFDDIFADIQANIPALEIDESLGESSDEEEPVLFSRKQWSLPPNNSSETDLAGGKSITSPAGSTTDSGMSLTCQDRRTTSNSSLSDCDQDSIEFLNSPPTLVDYAGSQIVTSSSSTATISTQTSSIDINQSEEQLYSTAISTQTSSIDINQSEKQLYSTTISTQTSSIDINQSEEDLSSAEPQEAHFSDPDNSTQQEFALRFDLIEHLNLSHLLDRTNEVTVFPPALSDSDFSDVDIAEDSSSLMEELARLSRQQQQDAAPEPDTCIDRHFRAPSSGSNSSKDHMQDVGVLTVPSVSSVGVTACLGAAQRMPGDTVFLDLRNQEGATCNQRNQRLPSSICRILGIKQEGDKDLPSSSDEEDDLLQWQDQRRKVKEASLSCTKQKNGSQPKLQQMKLKQAEQKTRPDSVGLPLRVHDEEITKKQHLDIDNIQKRSGKTAIEFGTSTNYDTMEQKDENIHTVRQAWVSSPPNNQTSPTQNHIVSEEKENITEKVLKQIDKGIKERKFIPPSEQKEEVMGVVSGCEKDLITIKKDQVKQTSVTHKRLITEEVKAKRQRLHKSLQNLKPQTSAQGRHPPAPSTPVLFHEEASYESSVSSLPQLEISDGNSYLLSYAKLSSCGELAAVRQGPRGRTTPDTHCLSTLLAWLICLVQPPHRSKSIDYAEICGAPFRVVGLQQSWHEGQLWIEIGICSRAKKGEDPQENKAKRKSKGSTAFRQAVAKFLSTNTLHSVFARLCEFTSMGLSGMLISKRNLSTLLTVNPDASAMQRVFEAMPGFFWQTTEGGDATGAEDKTGVGFHQGPEVQNTVMLMEYDVYHQPECVLDVLTRAHRRALDVAGVRLVYQHTEMLEEKPANGSQCLNISASGQSQTPLLAFALRGPQAITRWQDEVGPNDAKLAQRTDPNSLRALHSNGAKQDHLFWCPRNSQNADTALVRWFGGRVPSNGVINVGSDVPQAAISENAGSPSKRSHLLTSPLHRTSPRPPCVLTATTDTCMFLFVSPLVPVRLLGHVLCTCYHRGFCTQGIRRIHLNTNRLSGLGLSQEQMSVFCPKRTNLLDTHSLPLLASTILLLRRENAMHHSLSLTEPLVAGLTDTSLGQCCFLTVPYTDSMLKQLGGDFSQTPNPAAHPVDLLRHAFHSNPELEQVCVVTLLKEKATVSAGTVLKQLLVGDEARNVENEGKPQSCGFELLGLKLLPSLSMYQAKEFTPCKIGDKLWQSSLHTLTSKPALVAAVRGVDAFGRLSNFIKSYSDSAKLKTTKTGSSSLDMFVSCTPELACRQLSTIFSDKELFSDQSARRNLHLLPPPRRVIRGSFSGSSESLSGAEASVNRRQRGVLEKSPFKASLNSVETLRHGEMSVLQSLLERPHAIPTVCVLKPGTATKHLGKVLRRVAQEGFTVINMKMMLLTTSEVSEMMVRKEGDLQCHVTYMTSGPVVALCLQRENGIGRLLELLGPSDPRAAKKQSQFFLRGSFGDDSVHNALYGSETYEEAIRDVKLLFPEGVCCPSTVDLKAEGIPCLALDEVLSFTANRTLVELSTQEQTCFDSSSPGMTLLPSSLLEINCLLLLPHLSACRTTPGRRTNSTSAEIIEALLAAGFHLIGLRMALLGVPEAADCAKLLSASLPTDWKPHDLASKLSQPSCIVMAVLRDNAVTCFDTLCDSSPKLRSLSENNGKYMLAGKTMKQARQMVECFFDHVMPNRKAKLVCSSPSESAV